MIPFIIVMFIYLKDNIIYLSFLTILIKWYVVTIYLVLKDLNRHEKTAHNSGYSLKGGSILHDQHRQCMAQLLCRHSLAHRVYRLCFPQIP